MEKHVTEVPVAVIGNDAVLAALPAHPIQLAHACHLIGYQLVVPASWGDELVAEHILRALDARGRQPAVVCVCSLVRDRLLAGGAELTRFLIQGVSAPVAVARYLRALHVGPRLQLTYVGGCEGGNDPIYDARLHPEELLARIASTGIELTEQPVFFDDIVPPDRRRHFSLPGGCPTPEALWQRPAKWRLVESQGGDLASELAEQLMGHEAIVVDVSARLGCRCTGAGRAQSTTRARLAVMSLEPPRSPLPILDPLHVAVGLAEARPTSPTVAAAAGDEVDRAFDIEQSPNESESMESPPEAPPPDVPPPDAEGTGEERRATREDIPHLLLSRRPIAKTPPHALRAFTAGARRRRSTSTPEVADRTPTPPSAQGPAPLIVVGAAVPSSEPPTPAPTSAPASTGVASPPAEAERPIGVVSEPGPAAGVPPAPPPVSAALPRRKPEGGAAPGESAERMATPPPRRPPRRRVHGRLPEDQSAESPPGAASRARDFWWLLLSFLAGAGAAIGAWSAWNWSR